MIRIKKYKLMEYLNVFEIPKESKIMAVEGQENAPHVYVMINTKMKEMEKRCFMMVVGDERILDFKNKEYIGTAVCSHQWEYHIFELKDKRTIELLKITKS